MLETLVKMVLDLGIVALAEGVETASEGAACRQIGFQLAQGFHYGKPAQPTASRPPGITPARPDPRMNASRVLPFDPSPGRLARQAAAL